MPISCEVIARIRSSSVIIFSRVSERTRAISTTSETGLVRKSSAPASSPRTRSDGESSAVTITTGMKCVAGFDFSRRQTSKPSMSGIMMSSRMMSHSARAAISNACLPFAAVITSKYSADSRASSSFTLAGISSTTRIRADIFVPLPDKTPDSFDELADRDRLRQVSFATAFADALFVALHRKSGDGDDGNGVQIGIVLDPARDVEARDLRQLDIHQDQVGTMTPHQVERLDPLVGANGLVTMGLEKVAEELHVELVVFDDKDGFCHPALPIPDKLFRFASAKRVRHAKTGMAR